MKRYILFIVRILAIFLVLNGAIKSFQYSKIYEKEPEEIVKQQDFQMLWFSNSINSESLKSHCILYCGASDIGNIKLDNSAKINITLSKRFGKIKVLWKDKIKNTVISNELTQKQNEINLEAGEYEIFIVGQFFTGNTYFTSNNAFFNKTTKNNGF